MTALTVTATVTDSLGLQASSSASATIDDFVLGDTFPTDSGLTVPVESLTPSNGGALTIDGSDQLFENIRFNRRLSITGKRNRFLNCWAAGPANPPAGTPINSLITCTNSNAEDNVFEHCLVAPQTPQVEFGNGLFGHRFTAYRCEFRHAIDAIGIYNGSNTSTAPVNVAILGNLIHDLAYWTPYPSQPDNQTHNDCIQTHYNIDGLTIVGNILDDTISQDIGNWVAKTNTCGMASIMCSPVGGRFYNVTIEQNWISGGVVGINLGQQGAQSTVDNLKIRGNRWGRDFCNGQTSYVQKNTALHFTDTNELFGNVYGDTGEAANRGACCGTWP